MGQGRINTEIRTNTSHDIAETIKQVRQALGEIYSNKNLGLNVRYLTLDTANVDLDVSDAIIIASTTDPSFSNIYLPGLEEWSTVYQGKSPLIIIYNNGSVTLTPKGKQGTSELINGFSTITSPYTILKQTVAVFYADYTNGTWRTIQTGAPGIHYNKTNLSFDFTLPGFTQIYYVQELGINSGITLTIDANAYLEIG